MIRFECGNCHQTLEVDDRLAGVAGQCNRCGASVVAPQPQYTSFQAIADDADMQPGSAFRKQIAPIEEESSKRPQRISILRIGCGLISAFFMLIVLGAIVSSSSRGSSSEEPTQSERREAVRSAIEHMNATLKATPTVSLSEYSSLQTGMSYEAACQIIGSQGVEMSSNSIDGIPGVMPRIDTVMYMWKNSDGSNMTAMFQNNRLNMKAQFGLR